MKGFFKSLLASMLGCFIVLGIFFLMIFSVFAAMSLGSSEKYKLRENTVLTLNLEGTLVERSQDKNPFLDALGQSVDEVGLEDVLSSIKKAKENEKIKGIYINAGLFSASAASLKEIRDELIDFKESGKFIVAYADIYTQGAYYLSSVADKIIINPQGRLDVHGLSVSPTFYTGLLKKVGIEMQIFKVGTFKSAVEPFMLEKMSDANREQVNSFLSDAWLTYSTEMSESRKLSVEELNTIADSLPALKNSEFYLAHNLVDTLMYETDVKSYIQNLVGVENKDDMRYATIENISTVPFLKKDKSDNIIAVLYAEGNITDGSGNEGITSKRYVKELQKLKDNDKVKAVVFRVNSGGGSAYASEQIWKAVSELKLKKPIIVSMGDYAASGGYYISCNATKIFAQPNTLTGSIGIFGMFPNFEGLSQKVGLSYDNVKTNKFADFGDVMRPMRDDEKVILQNTINQGYDLFLTRCSDGREMAKDSLALIAEGRVWTGNQALKNGLVDALGGIDDAIAEAIKAADLGDDYSLRSYPAKVSFLEELFKTAKEDMATKTMKEYLGNDYVMFKAIKDMKEQDYIQARIPYDFNMQ